MIFLLLLAGMIAFILLWKIGIDLQMPIWYYIADGFGFGLMIGPFIYFLKAFLHGIRDGLRARKEQ